MSHGINIPPESTGPTIGVVQRYVLDFDNQTNEFQIGDLIEGVTSGASGTITSIYVEGYAANSGRLHLKNVNGTFVNNEQLEVGGLLHALVDTSNHAFQKLNYQQTVLSDPENPEFKQRIDRFGATLNTFTDGSPIFGPFGSLTVGEQQSIQDYRFAYEEEASSFWDQETTGGTISYEANTSNIVLATTTANNSMASRTSNFYHPYVPGTGTLVEMTIQVGDTGKTGVTREWGYFDDYNGVFWRLENTTLQLVVRSNTSGSVVENVVDSTDFNKDKLDGSDSIGFNLDVSKGNIYWLDLQWLGGGRIRCGVIEPSGARVIAHIFEHSNVSNLPYMRTATLPIRVAQYNTSTTGSSSEMRWTCGTVKHTSKTLPKGDRFADSLNSIVTVQAGDGEVPLLSFRPKTTFGGLTNRAITRFLNITFVSTSASEAPVMFRIRGTDSNNLSNASFASVSSLSTVEKDTSATGFVSLAAAPTRMNNICIPGETKTVQNPSTPEVHDTEIFLGADGTSQPSFVLTAEVIGSGNVYVTAATNWEELRF